MGLCSAVKAPQPLIGVLLLCVFGLEGGWAGRGGRAVLALSHMHECVAASASAPQHENGRDERLI